MVKTVSRVPVSLPPCSGRQPKFTKPHGHFGTMCAVHGIPVEVILGPEEGFLWRVSFLE